MHPSIERLNKACGFYKGQGENHHQEAFQGELNLSTILSGKGIQLVFRAMVGDKLVHNEHSLIAPDDSGKVCLWNLNSNGDGLQPHQLDSEETTTEGNWNQHFIYGDLEDTSQFRQKIQLTVHAGGAISYSYAWGLPGEALGERSHIKLFRP